ncbi:hypothetical protein SN4111_04200 [Ligilactobacillus agilis]|uniref:6-pyruvoyl-tetrahydropterin synthase-related protein n=1 Tax=Ligilactobacillus agilis TaxID=1601 RepID=UPI001437A526|nr:6-pyruvoyl-tetrahydropterin synthase-related protein [Ligilactobacillus agilis]GET14158.1 hypothetical protein SN4111_04200 [Ligilactobacillus agilis]
MNKFLKNLVLNIFFLLVGFFYELPFITGSKPLAYYFKLNGDQLFHINRLHSLSHVFTNPIAFDSYHGVGYGVNFFYPWITFYPASLFSKLLNSEAKGMVVFLATVTYATLAVSYYACKKYLNWNSKQSIIFSLLWTFSTYRGINFFNRTDIGELLATIFIPLLVTSFLDFLLHKEYKNWIVISLSMSAILLSHVLSTLIMTIVLLLILIINYRHSLDVKVWINLLKAVIATSLTTMLYWAPMLQQKYYIPTLRPFTAVLSDWALNIDDLFIHSIGSSYLTPNIGLLLILIIIYGVFNFSKLSANNKQLLAVTLVCLWLCTKAFPWHLLQNTPVNYLQFPWRFMLIATLFLCLLGATFLSKIQGKYLILLFSIIFASNYALIQGLPSENILPMNRDTSIAKYYKDYVNNDYYPKAAEKEGYNIEQKEFILNGKKKKANYKESSTTFTTTLINNNNKKMVADIPILYYLGVTAKVNGKNVTILKSARGTVKLLLNKGKNKIVISSKYTKLAVYSQIISLVTFVLCCCWLIYTRLRKN